MRSGIGVAGEEVATITPNSTLSLTVDDGSAGDWPGSRNR